MPRRSNTAGNFTVGDDKRTWPSLGAAISFAQNVACKSERDVTLYIREIGVQGALARVSRVGKIVHTHVTGRS